jgi:hypothetical protein
MEPCIDSKESDSASLCSLVGPYTNEVIVPSRQAGDRFLGSLENLQVRAQLSNFIFNPFFSVNQDSSVTPFKGHNNQDPQTPLKISPA